MYVYIEDNKETYEERENVAVALDHVTYHVVMDRTKSNTDLNIYRDRYQTFMHISM